MKKIIGIAALSFLTFNAFAGFETPEDQRTKRLNERAVETKNYIDSMVGRTAWYNSNECLTEKIYPDTSNMSYGSAIYSTNGEYKPIIFESGEMLQDTYTDYVTFKIKIGETDEGYIKTDTTMPLKISDNDYIGCFKANKPIKKESTISKSIDDILFGWSYSCKKDKFNGSKSCYLHRANSDLMVGIYNGQHSVYVGRDHYPRSQSVIKIDSNTPIYGYEGSSSTPQKAIEQMKRGKIAYTRYKEWPYDYHQDGEVDLTGFTEKYNEMMEEYKKL